MSEGTRVKICGITQAADGIDALAAGADAIGFVLAAGSKRQLAAADAAALLADVRARAGRPFLAVAVVDTVDAAAARDALEARGFDRVQLHGRASAAQLAACLDVLGPSAARAWGVAHVGAAAPEGYDELPCEAVLLDTAAPGPGGGGGVPFDWSLAAPLARVRKVVLAGGLTPENVAPAIGAVSPWMVDVSSGVEAEPGVKDRRRVEAFIAAVRHAH